MARFIGLLDGKEGAYGIAFPDAPGCTAMGKTLSEVIRNASGSLGDWLEDGNVSARSVDELRADPEVIDQLAGGSAFVVVPVILEDSRPVKANISLEAGLLAAIDEAADSAGLTRSAFLVSAAKEKILSNV